MRYFFIDFMYLFPLGSEKPNSFLSLKKALPVRCQSTLASSPDIGNGTGKLLK